MSTNREKAAIEVLLRLLNRNYPDDAYDLNACKLALRDLQKEAGMVFPEEELLKRYSVLVVEPKRG